MPRLRRFPDHRFVGLRREMRFYDCDDAAQFESLETIVAATDAVARLGVSTFGPDTAVEARNRGFRPAR